MNDFRIKICGITRAEDALAAVAAGADAIGLNLSATSKRCVSAATAQAIVSSVRPFFPKMKFVGVFVEQSPEEAEALAEQVGLDVIQLHGDHDVSVLVRPWSRPVLWVARVPICAAPEMAARLSAVAEAAVACACWTMASAGRSGTNKLAGILVDAYTTGDYGGTGQTVAWEPLGQRAVWPQRGWSAKAWPQGLPLVLAGGLNAENVATAITQARPTAVDVASGVESQPGIKSHSKMLAFVSAARVSLFE